ncbi:SSI family serine proteinase inhibitor [Streptomyces sp. NPDC059063]|uniref:SSI family serine proteinase inhibitor n=1 Tax=unclassified Streptomyces TaxID=2593676 RepID=UPI0036A80942
MRSLTVTAALLALVAAAAPAAATPRERGLILTISGSHHTWARGVVLHCAPEPSGHHPHARQACAQLDAADGDLDALPGERRHCIKEYDPVTASATGPLRDRTVTWRRTYPNACVLRAATGAAFAF